jgi:hypothetical protein
VSTESEAFEGWAILELMGHRRLAGWVSEQTIAGAAFIRLDVADEGDPASPGSTYDPSSDSYVATQFYSPQALYCLTPTTKEVALAVARFNKPAPVQRWELPAAQETPGAEFADFEG